MFPSEAVTVNPSSDSVALGFNRIQVKGLATSSFTVRESLSLGVEVVEIGESGTMSILECEDR